MRKLGKTVLVTFSFLLLTLYLLPSKVLAQWIDGNYARYTFFQNGVPHFNKYGKIVTQYSADSFYPLGLYWVDLGPVPDAQGIARGQMWNSLSPGRNINDSTYLRNTLPEVKAANFNTVFPALPLTPPNQWEIDLIDQSGLKTIVNVWNPAVFFANNKFNWTVDLFKQEINRLKNHSSVFLYHLFDERPDITPNDYPMDEQKWKLVHDTIKSVDPDRAVYANVAGAVCWPATYSDFSMFDDYETYWINNPDSGQLERTAALSGLAYYKSTNSTCNKPVIGIYQSFGATNAVAGFALPTAEELKAQYLVNLLNGSAGIILFVQQNSNWGGNPMRPWYDFDPDKANGINSLVNVHLWNQAAAMNAFVETNKKVFLSPTATDLYNVYFNATEGLARSIRVILKNTNEPNTRYLLAVNTEKARSIMKVSFPGKTITKVTLLTSNRLVDNPSASELQIDMGGYGGELFKIEFSPFETITPSQTPTPIPCPMKQRGDLDCSQTINIFDYNILVSNFGNTGSVGFHVADLNPNGKIDIFDYNILVSNFGATQ